MPALYLPSIIGVFTTITYRVIILPIPVYSVLLPCLLPCPLPHHLPEERYTTSLPHHHTYIPLSQSHPLLPLPLPACLILPSLPLHAFLLCVGLYPLALTLWLVSSGSYFTPPCLPSLTVGMHGSIPLPPFSHCLPVHLPSLPFPTTMPTCRWSVMCFLSRASLCSTLHTWLFLLLLQHHSVCILRASLCLSLPLHPASST